MTDLESILETVIAAVRAAADASLCHFGHPTEVETKADASPVTAADRAAEREILRTIRDRWPEHSILSEESGELAGDPVRCWIVDPLDGTRGFTRGGSFWGPLVAYEEQGTVVAGAFALPVLGRTYWAARGLGAFADGQRLRLSGVGRLGEATLSLGELRALLAPPHGVAVSELLRGAASCRCYGDVAGCAMLLDGRADAWLEAGVRPWDIAPVQVLVEEAGGRFTDFAGRSTPRSGQALAATHALHGVLLDRLRPPDAASPTPPGPRSRGDP